MTVLSSREARPVDPALVSHALEVAGRLANDAADVIMATAGHRTRSDQPPHAADSPFAWVTDADRTLERHTRWVLDGEFPGVPVVGHEGGPGATEAPLRWVVDPVDGTANHVAGMPWCAYSLALVDADGPVVGVVADPYRAQIYAAARGRGMRANGTAVQLDAQCPSAGGLVCTELTRSGPWVGMGAFAERAARAGAGIRVLGCAALAVVQVALGQAMAVVLDSYHEGDIAGAVALALEAGAVVLDRSGGQAGLPLDGLLVAAPAMADEVRGWWTEALRERR